MHVDLWKLGLKKWIAIHGTMCLKTAKNPERIWTWLWNFREKVYLTLYWKWYQWVCGDVGRSAIHFEFGIGWPNNGSTQLYKSVQNCQNWLRMIVYAQYVYTFCNYIIFFFISRFLQWLTIHPMQQLIQTLKKVPQ